MWRWWWLLLGQSPDHSWAMHGQRKGARERGVSARASVTPLVIDDARMLFMQLMVLQLEVPLLVYGTAADGCRRAG